MNHLVKHGISGIITIYRAIKNMMSWNLQLKKINT